MSDVIHVQKITSINFFDLSPKFNTELHAHDAWELLYVDSGSLSLRADSRDFILKQGEIFLNHPGLCHSTTCDGVHSTSFYNLHFVCRSKALEHLAQKPLTLSGELTSCMRAMVKESEKTYAVSQYPLTKLSTASKGGEQLIRNYLEILLLRLSESEARISFKKEKESLNLSGKPFADEIIKYLKANLSETISLDALCKRFHYGKTYLCVNFKKETGMSIFRYQLNLKIERAKKLLLETQIPIYEISEKLGFESPEYFTRCFVKQVGYPPSVYRKMLITDAKIKK